MCDDACIRGKSAANQVDERISMCVLRGDLHHDYLRTDIYCAFDVINFILEC